MLQILGTIERFDLKSWGPRDPRSWHVIAEAMKLAYADREKWLGDTDFVSVPLKGLTDPAYLAQRSQLLSPDKPLGTYEAGTPPGAQPRTASVSGEVPATTHFVAVDAAGNIATMTSTVEGSFGSQLIASGFVLNNELTDFSFVPEAAGAPVANRVQPGKRPLSSMTPTIVYDSTGKPVLAVGSAGGKRIIMHVTKTVIGFIDFGLPVQEAIALPNIYFSNNSTLVEQGTFLAEMSAELSKRDGLVVASQLPSKVNAAERTKSGWRGAADAAQRWCRACRLGGWHSHARGGAFSQPAGDVLRARGGEGDAPFLSVRRDGRWQALSWREHRRRSWRSPPRCGAWPRAGRPGDARLRETARMVHRRSGDHGNRLRHHSLPTPPTPSAITSISSATAARAR
jgi:hypothetical protein